MCVIGLFKIFCWAVIFVMKRECLVCVCVGGRGWMGGGGRESGKDIKFGVDMYTYILHFD